MLFTILNYGYNVEVKRREREFDESITRRISFALLFYFIDQPPLDVFRYDETRTNPLPTGNSDIYNIEYIGGASWRELKVNRII